MMRRILCRVQFTSQGMQDLLVPKTNIIIIVSCTPSLKDVGNGGSKMEEL